MKTNKLHIVVSPTDAGYYIVNLVRGTKGITLRSYQPTEAVDARRFAQELSDVIDCGWTDKRKRGKTTVNSVR